MATVSPLLRAGSLLPPHRNLQVHRPLLLKKGHKVVAVHQPLTSLADDVAAVKRVIEAQVGEVVLVGHSYGGAVITEAGNVDRVTSRVYVTAFALAAGESINELAKAGPPPEWAASEEMWRYHDLEWGVPVHDDRRHFEFMILEGAQAGLSWSTILRKRDGYRRAFANFDAEKVARFTPRQIERVLTDHGIIRNRLKVTSAVSNARRFLALQSERGSFAEFLWGYYDGKPRVNRWKTVKQIRQRRGSPTR